MSFADTPLTRLAGTAQQRIAPDPGADRRRDRPLRRERPAVLPRRGAAGAGRAAGAPVAALAGLGGADLRRTAAGQHRRRLREAAPRQHRGPAAGRRPRWMSPRWRRWAWRCRRWAAWCWAWPWPRAGWMPQPPTRWARSTNCSRPKLGARTPKPPRVAAAIAADIELAARFLRLTRAGHGMNAKRLVISGRVQGVGYREWMVAEGPRARDFRLGAQPADGSVEALVAGDIAAVEELLRALPPRSPRMADVVSIEEELADPPESVSASGSYPTGRTPRPTRRAARRRPRPWSPECRARAGW